jgi:cyclohexa-1,5-dienecarbonyl-CoA hydratase
MSEHVAEFIHYAEEEQVARIVLDRPPLNILTVDMLEELNAALEAAASHPSLKALVLSGAGKAFCAGVDIEDHIGTRAALMLDVFHNVFRTLRALDCVTIAAVHGAALGGGAELATFCDVVVAADGATFGQPEIKVGVFPPIAALHYPARVGLARAMRLILSGDTIKADEACRIGLVDRVVAADHFAAALESEVAHYRSLSAAVLRLAKRAVRDAHGLPFDEALSTLEEIYHRDLMTTADAEEGLRAFLEKRKPVWKDR